MKTHGDKVLLSEAETRAIISAMVDEELTTLAYPLIDATPISFEEEPTQEMTQEEAHITSVKSRVRAKIRRMNSSVTSIAKRFVAMADW